MYESNGKIISVTHIFINETKSKNVKSIVTLVHSQGIT
jgi:hypothetical protein